MFSEKLNGKFLNFKLVKANTNSLKNTCEYAHY